MNYASVIHMTFRQSLILSLTTHVLILGAGLTFAGYAGGLFQGHHEPMTVLLVGTDGRSATDGESRKKSRGAPFRSEQESVSPLLEQALEKVSQVPDVKSTYEDAGQSAQQRSDGRSIQQHAQEGSGDDKGKSLDNGTAAGSPTGSVPSEQWAVIVSSLERVKSYPRLARERGIEGIVRLRFHVRSQGEVDHVEIVKSSGYEILDSASVRTVYRAAPMPYVSGWVEVPIAYMLK